MMNKENIMKKFDISEERYNQVLKEQYEKFKKRFPKKEEEKLKIQAENSMVSRLMRDKLAEVKTQEVVLLGQIPTISFNYFRVLAGEKIREQYGDKFLEMCQNNAKELLYKGKSKLFDSKGNIIDNFGGVINENNPREKDKHIVFGVTSKNEIFVGVVSEKDKNTIKIGQPLKIKTKKSKIQKQYFGITPVNITEITEDEVIEDKTLVGIFEKFFEKIKSYLKFPNTAQEIKNSDFNDILAIKGNVFDIEKTNFNTVVSIMLENGDLINCRLPEHLVEDMIRFATLDLPTKFIVKKGMSTDEEGLANADVVAMWCDAENISKEIQIEIAPTDESTENKLKDW